MNNEEYEVYYNLREELTDLFTLRFKGELEGDSFHTEVSKILKSGTILTYVQLTYDFRTLISFYYKVGGKN